MKNAFFGLITLLMLLGVATYGAIQLYHLPPNHARWTAQIDNALLKVADDITQENQNRAEWDSNAFERENRGANFVLAYKAVLRYTQNSYKRLDSLYFQKNTNQQEIKKALARVQQQLPFIGAHYFSDTTTMAEQYRQETNRFFQITQNTDNITFAQAMLVITVAETKWIDIISSRYAI